MCLIIKDSKKVDKKDVMKLAQVAKEDIPVWKVLKLCTLQNGKEKYYTPYQRKRVYRDTHYYQTGKKFSFDSVGNLIVNRGLHSWSSPFKANKVKRFASDRVVVQATIPKGSIYFIGKYSDYVSDNLIIH